MLWIFLILNKTIFDSSKHQYHFWYWIEYYHHFFTARNPDSLISPFLANLTFVIPQETQTAFLALLSSIPAYFSFGFFFSFLNMCDSQHPSQPTRTPGINSNSHFVVVAHTRAKNADWNIPSIRICIFCVTGVLSWYVLVRKKKKTARKRGSDEKKGCVTPPTRKGMKFPEGKKHKHFDNTPSSGDRWTPAEEEDGKVGRRQGRRRFFFWDERKWGKLRFFGLVFGTFCGGWLSLYKMEYTMGKVKKYYVSLDLWAVHAHVVYRLPWIFESNFGMGLESLIARKGVLSKIYQIILLGFESKKN